MSQLVAAPSKPRSAIRISTYDKVSACLWAMILVFSVLALIVVLMWLQIQRKKSIAEVIAVVPLAPGEIGEDKPLGVGDDAEDPGVEEFYEVDVPQLADAVEAVTDAPSRLRGMLAAVDGTAVEMGKGRGLGSRGGGGRGGGGGPADRWSIEYESESFAKYLDQLSAFGIEIGFVSKVTDQVEVVFNLNTAPQLRTSTKAEERRVYFIHANSKLRGWDLRVAQNAGVKPGGKIMVQFYPAATTKVLAELEAAEATRRQLQIPQIAKTMFKVRAQGSQFEYFVADMIAKDSAAK